MKINVKKIPPDGLNIESEEPKGLLDVKISFVTFKEPVHVSFFISLTGKTLLINGKLRTKADLVCSRCLKEFEQNLRNDDFTLDVDVSGQDEVDITDNIREEIVVLLPIKPLCKKDCKGLCPRCGQDLNKKQCSCKPAKEDIRWKGLGKLKL